MVCRLSHHSRATLSDIQVHIFILSITIYDTHYYTLHHYPLYTLYTLVNIIIRFVHQFR